MEKESLVIKEIHNITLDSSFLPPSISHLMVRIGVLGAISSSVAGSYLLKSEELRSYLFEKYGNEDYVKGVFLIVGFGILSLLTAVWGKVYGPTLIQAVDVVESDEVIEVS